MKIDIIKEYAIRGVGHMIGTSNKEDLTGKVITLRTNPFLLSEKIKDRTYKLTNMESPLLLLHNKKRKI